MKLKKISLQKLSQNELQRRQAKALMGGKVCECTIECSALCSCTYTQALQERQASILVHPVTQDTSDRGGTKARDQGDITNVKISIAYSL